MATRRRCLERCATAVAALWAGAAAAVAQTGTFRLGIPAATLGDFNVNDARAAFRVWGEELGRGAGLETSAAFATMSELNPQLGKALTVVARSPRLVGGLFGLHKAFPAAAAGRLRAGRRKS